ncbi:hypothetical protein [Oceanobacillus neutriphilus]|uniref:DUF4352 domain-containing protein n=1 Tax=Oceanobacillus neutriphilus TaxID=531815 RepID=A0ABQ2NWD2_9BACI|nr:hypothetical protein [Oceanobacillus neutriphilus]GGP12104.1 hypothetical protein GCM10011346_26770 [Oceanobacillus neutriphilus]
MQDVPEIVFHTPQDERRDQIGTYNIGEDMYIVDYGGDTFYKVNIGNVEITEEPEEIDQRDDSDGFIAIDMTFENQLDEEVLLHQTFPQPYIADKQLVGHSPYLVLDNELVQDLYDGSEGKIAPGETVEGTAYLEIINDNTEDVQLLYPNPSLLTFPDYGMWINYNLED